MWRYATRRCLSGIAVMAGVAVVVFVLLHLVGGDPAAQMLGPHASAQSLAEARAEYGFDRPLIVQFVRYLGHVLVGDFGRSFATGEPIADMVLRAAPVSFSIAGPAFIFTAVIGYLVALLSALHRGRFLDRWITVACALLMSVPALVWIIVGQYALAFRLGWFPISGFSWSRVVASVALPVLIWVIAGVGYDIRFFRHVIVAQLSEDYLRAVRAKGVSEGVILFKHVLRNSLAPAMSRVVVTIPFLVLGSFLLERFFSIPGLGNATIEAVHQSDWPVVQAMALVHAFLFVGGSVVVDLLNAWVDPRVCLK